MKINHKISLKYVGRGYREGKAVCLTKNGLRIFISQCNFDQAKPYKEIINDDAKFNIWIHKQFEPDNIFTFIKHENLPLAKDSEQDWFQQLWIPLTQQQCNSLDAGYQNIDKNILKIVQIAPMWVRQASSSLNQTGNSSGMN